MFQKKEREEREVAQSCPTLNPNAQYRRGLLCYLVVFLFFFFSFFLFFWCLWYKEHTLWSQKEDAVLVLPLSPM